MPATAVTSPMIGTSRAPSRGISCCESTEPTMMPAVNGRNARPASMGV